MLRNYWLIAVRKLWKHKGHALINVLGLTVGLASCLIIFLITHFELGYDHFHPDGDRIYRVVSEINQNGRQGHITALPGPAGQALPGELTGCDAVTGFFNWSSSVIIPGKDVGEQKKEFDPLQGEPSPIILADAQYFQIFRYKWLAGNPATSLNDPFRVVLSTAEVKHYFGDITPQEAMGRLVIYSDSLQTYVSGVVQDWEHNTDFAFRDFISYSTAQRSFIGKNLRLDDWHMISGASQAYVLLKKGTTVAQVQRQFAAFVKKYNFSGPFYAPVLGLQPLADIHFNTLYHDTYSRQAHLPTLYGLMGIAVFILLLAVINFVNLSTAQSLQRTKEVGIRKVLGSRRKHIVWQFLGETFLLTLLAVILSLLITPPIITLLRQYMPAGLRFEFTIPTLLFLLGMTVATCLLAGLYPAKVISALLPALSLKGQATRNLVPNRFLHRGLIVFQFTISLAFIICTVIVTRQLHYVLNADLGFDKDAIINFHAMGPMMAPPKDREVLAQRLRALPGVAMVASNKQTPQSSMGRSGTFVYHGPKDDSVNMALWQEGDTNYLRLFGIKLAAGRNYFANDSVTEYLINETMARQLGFRQPQDAIGQRANEGTIVGVVKDFHTASLQRAIAPLSISYNKYGNLISIRLASTARQPQAIATVISQVERLWRATYPNEKVSYTFFDDDIAKLYKKEQQVSGLMRLAMIIAISISCMGLLSLATFMAEQRKKEISIRKVFGASMMRLFRMLTFDFLWPVALAFVIATPVAWYFMYDWLKGFAYKTTVPWWLFGLCGLAAVVIALLTVGLQVLRAARVNPAKALRTD
ncbi:MAG: ABC transporter permease [Bacteroidetes bacterium]|nr:ABC transporter permease [Bacteroidota bacterium]